MPVSSDGVVSVTVVPERAGIEAVADYSATPGITHATLYRTGPDGARVPVRGADRAPTQAGVLAGIVDHEAPLGVPVLYEARGHIGTSSDTDVSAGVIVVIDPPDPVRVWLKDVGQPERSLLLLLEQAPAWTRAARQGLYHVKGRRNPVVVSDVRAGYTGALQVYTTTHDERLALWYLLDSGATLLLQAAPGYGIEDVYVSVGNAAESHLEAGDDDPWRRWVLDLTQVDAPVGGITGGTGVTYDDIDTEFTTYEDLMMARPTYLSVLTGSAGVT